jgi:hypothetical protein
VVDKADHLVLALSAQHEAIGDAQAGLRGDLVVAAAADAFVDTDKIGELFRNVRMQLLCNGIVFVFRERVVPGAECCLDFKAIAPRQNLQGPTQPAAC